MLSWLTWFIDELQTDQEYLLLGVFTGDVQHDDVIGEVADRDA